MIKTTNILKDLNCELKNRYKKTCIKIIQQRRQEAERITRMSDIELERSMIAEVPLTPSRSGNDEQENETEDTESREVSIAP